MLFIARTASDQRGWYISIDQKGDRPLEREYEDFLKCGIKTGILLK
jgi:hypothetical protein